VIQILQHDLQLDTGQRDNFYDVGRIKLKTGALTPTGRLLINFDYFSHGSGDYFDVDHIQVLLITLTYLHIFQILQVKNLI
jgi:hypothetical protein